MDALILSLTSKQHKKYLSLLDCEQVDLNFEFEKAKFDAYSDEKIKNAKDKIVSSSEKIVNFPKYDSFFSQSLTKEEIEEIIPLYYETVREISKVKQELYGEALFLSRIIRDIDKSHLEISQKYGDFLPYKAALGKSERYATEISRIDAEFFSEISMISDNKKAFAKELARISTICDVLIPEFFEKSSLAAGAPRFKNFNNREFFSIVASFIEKVKNV